MQIRVFIVSNMRLYREGLAVLLRGCPSIEVLGAGVHDARSQRCGAASTTYGSIRMFRTKLA